VTEMSDQMDPHLMLTVTYINLKRYDLADQALARARRISPGDPQIEKLTALLDRRRAAIS
jgi:cytochrome c-type biogenesis protein CcmH/NrfG